MPLLIPVGVNLPSMTDLGASRNGNHLHASLATSPYLNFPFNNIDCLFLFLFLGYATQLVL